MTTTKKLVIAVVALSLALLCTIGGTLAFLVAKSNTVTNTFTYGKIELKVWEDKKTNETGKTYTNVVPGDVLAKDPVVTVTEGSEECYVYVLIDNQLGNAASYNIANTWIEVGKRGTKVLYRYNTVVDARTSAQDLAVFTTLTFVNTLTKDDVPDLGEKKVVISAYAHQSDNTTEELADDAAIKWAEVDYTLA